MLNPYLEVTQALELPRAAKIVLSAIAQHAQFPASDEKKRSKQDPSRDGTCHPSTALLRSITAYSTSSITKARTVLQKFSWFQAVPVMSDYEENHRIGTDYRLNLDLMLEEVNPKSRIGKRLVKKGVLTVTCESRVDLPVSIMYDHPQEPLLNLSTPEFRNHISYSVCKELWGMGVNMSASELHTAVAEHVLYLKESKGSVKYSTVLKAFKSHCRSKGFLDLPVSDMVKQSVPEVIELEPEVIEVEPEVEPEAPVETESHPSAPIVDLASRSDLDKAAIKIMRYIMANTATHMAGSNGKTPMDFMTLNDTVRSVMDDLHEAAINKGRDTEVELEYLVESIGNKFI